MTVQTTALRGDYTGNGVTVAFAVPFYFLENSHVQIEKLDTLTNVTTTLALTTDYTLAGAGVGTGGTATLLVAPLSTDRVSITRNVPYTQQTHYVEGDPFPSQSHEAALDKLTMLAQQLGEESSRAVRAPASAAGFDGELATMLPSRLVATNAAGTGFELVSPSSGSAAELAVDLADDTSAAKGAGQVGFDPDLAYADGTAGAALNTRVAFVTDADLTGTTDSTSALQAAVDALGGLPGKVRCPNGTVKIDGKVNCHIGCSFEFDGTILDISGNAESYVFAYNEGDVGPENFTETPTTFTGCRVNGKSTPPYNTTTRLFLVNRMPYFYAEDCALYHTQLAHVVGDSIFTKFHRVNCYQLVGINILQELGAVASWGPNAVYFESGYIEEARTTGVTGLKITSGFIVFTNTYFEAMETFFDISGGASVQVANCSMNVRASVYWSTSTPGTLTVAKIAGTNNGLYFNDCSLTFAGITGWSLHGVNVNVAATGAVARFSNVRISNLSDAAATETTLFKLAAGLTVTIDGCRFTVSSAFYTRFNIFDTQTTGSASIVFSNNDLSGAFFSSGNPDPINFEYNGGTSGTGYVSGVISNNKFLRVTNFTKISNCVIAGNSFTNSQAPIITDHPTAASRSYLSNNKFGTAPALTNPGTMGLNVGIGPSSIQTKRVGPGSIAAGAFANVAIVWPREWPDTNYVVTASVEDSTLGATSLIVDHVSGRTTTGCTVVVKNASAGAIATGVVHATSIHD